jgi:aromatic-L-amino-acid/L-tryptophan decarboxylase
MSSDKATEVGASGAGSLAMDPDEMRRLGYLAVDMIVERLEGLESEAAWKGSTWRELESRWSEAPPEEGGSVEVAMRQAVDEILPVAVRTDHPRFFAFVPGCPVWPAVLGDLLATGFNTFQGTWLGSAGPSALELIVLDWIREWLGLPEGSGGLLTSGGSAANLDAIVAALEDAGRPERPVVYFSDQGHSSLLRAARIAGVRAEDIRVVGTDGAFRMELAQLRAAIEEDRARGRTPVLVGANGGATNTGVVDPLVELAELCESEELWFHVDAAYGGFGALTEEGGAALRGIELADSVTLDPHKWLFQPFEVGCLLVRDPDTLVRTFSVHPEYLQDTQLGREQVNFGDRGLQLSRGFRALKIWLTVKSFGMRRLRAAIGQAIELAHRAEDYISSSGDLEILSPAALGVVCFRARPQGHEWTEPELESLNKSIQLRINQSGFAMMSSTSLRNRYSLRLCILCHTSTWEDVSGTLARIEDIARELAAR